MFDITNYQEVPRGTLNSLILYAQEGVPTGGFLHAVLSNDLRGAVARADKANLQAIKSIVEFVCNQLPQLCHGSPDKVAAWIETARAGKIVDNLQIDRLNQCLNGT